MVGGRKGKIIRCGQISGRELGSAQLIGQRRRPGKKMGAGSELLPPLGWACLGVSLLRFRRLISFWRQPLPPAWLGPLPLPSSCLYPGSCCPWPSSDPFLKRVTQAFIACCTYLKKNSSTPNRPGPFCARITPFFPVRGPITIDCIYSFTWREHDGRQAGQASH
jgi:hypothetical protein